MGEEPAETGQAPARRRSRAATSESKPSQNGGLPRSGRRTGKDSSAAVQTEAKPGPGQPEEFLGLYEPPPGGLISHKPEEISASPDETPQGLAPVDVGKPIHLSTARYRIATAAMTILAFVVIGAFVSLWRGKANIDDLTRVLEIIFAPIIALVGVALAFYYHGSGGGGSS